MNAYSLFGNKIVFNQGGRKVTVRAFRHCGDQEVTNPSQLQKIAASQACKKLLDDHTVKEAIYHVGEGIVPASIKKMQQKNLIPPPAKKLANRYPHLT